MGWFRGARGRGWGNPSIMGWFRGARVRVDGPEAARPTAARGAHYDLPPALADPVQIAVTIAGRAAPVLQDGSPVPRSRLEAKQARLQGQLVAFAIPREVAAF